MDTLQWGIIGCGDVTEVKSGPAFNKVANSRLVAVMRRDAEKAEDYARRHGVATWYDDARALVNDPEVNAIYVATPPKFHEAYTIMALEAGKPVYVEKPMSVDAAGAAQMVKVAAQTGTRLSVAHYRREQPLFKKVKALLEKKAIGDVRLVNFQLLQPLESKMIAQTATNWRVDPAISGGGLFNDLAPHLLDLMLYFFGEPLHAHGIATNQAGAYLADDLVTGHIQFRNGVVFNGSWCFSVSPSEERDSCEIIGSEGSIQFSIFKNRELVLSSGEVFEFEPLQHVQQPMIAAVSNYFLGKAANPCTGEDGVATMKLIEAFTGKG